MKRLGFVVTGIFLTILVLSGGCGTKATPPTAPAAPAPTQTVTGNLTGVNTPAQPGPDVVTVQTPQGPQTFTVTPTTKYTLDGKACTLWTAPL